MTGPPIYDAARGAHAQLAGILTAIATTANASASLIVAGSHTRDDISKDLLAIRAMLNHACGLAANITEGTTS